MTKFEVEITKSKKVNKIKGKYGAYLATFTTEDDRILLYNNDILQKIINTDSENEIWIQEAQAVHYTNLKKIKKIKMEIELE